jgi:hypothetical protein
VPAHPPLRVEARPLGKISDAIATALKLNPLIVQGLSECFPDAMIVPGTIPTYPRYAQSIIVKISARLMSSVLSTGYLKADVSPRYPLIPPGSESALVANYGTVRTSQCEPLVQGYKYNIPNSSLRLVPLPSPSHLLLALTDLLIHGTKGVYLCLFPAAVYLLL